MVRILRPPPRRSPNPIFHYIEPGDHLVRLFDPEPFGATATDFRRNGPRKRFDHHRGIIAGRRRLPSDDVDRGIYYASFALSGCLVEVFGDTGIIRAGNWHAANPTVTRQLKLLDLRGSGAMRAGAVAAVCKTSHAISQAWARHFYESPEYEICDGLVYSNAHNDESAIALFERCEDAIDCPASQVIRLDDPTLRYHMLAIARDNNLTVVPEAIPRAI